ncbi:MAG: HlyD family efflux transporter periplasmic adaptor subunit, partial [Bacteroidota bacterium]
FGWLRCQSIASMKSPSLFPFPLINHNVEGLRARHHHRSRIVYQLVVVALMVGAFSTPFIEVDVSKRSRGIIRPITANNQVIVGVSGLVVTTNLREHQAVCAGDTLLVISNEELAVLQSSKRDQLQQNQALIQDILAINATAGYPQLRTATYQKDYARYRQELDQRELEIKYAERASQRNEALLTAGAISTAEAEQSRFDLSMARASLTNLVHQNQQRWSQELDRYQRENLRLRSEWEQLRKQERQYLVIAPIDGTINQLSGVQEGNFISTGQTIATIAPDDALRVEVYVDPASIGLIRKGMPVQLQIDAYHPNRWGMAQGRVTDISPDVIEQQQSLAFVVQCSLDTDVLYLKNGFPGRFKPGMSLTAHFTLARRSLFDLLHDKVDHWLDPQNAPIAVAQ